MLITKYTDNELSTKEKGKFEKKLNKNPELLREYKLHLRLNEFMEGKFMSQHTEKDIFFNYADQFAHEAIKEYKNENSDDNELLVFLNSAKNEDESSLYEKNRCGEKEAIKKAVDNLAYKWVKDWKEEEQDNDYLKELKEFAASGLKQNEEELQKRSLKVIKRDKTISKVRIINKWYYVAASIAAIFIISINIWSYFYSAVNNSELFVSYYQPYSFVLDQTRDSDTKIESTFNKAATLYKSKKYLDASAMFKDLLSIDNNNVRTRFLYGLTLIEKENYLNAVKELVIITEQHDSFNLEARWYLALCYIKLDNNKKAKELFLELSLSKNFYQKRALEMLEDLGTVSK